MSGARNKQQLQCWRKRRNSSALNAPCGLKTKALLVPTKNTGVVERIYNKEVKVDPSQPQSARLLPERERERERDRDIQMMWISNTNRKLG